MNWLKLPKKVYFKRGSSAVALKELSDIYQVKKAFIITDANLYHTHDLTRIEALIRNQGISTAEYFTMEAQPTIADARGGLPKMLEFEPDFIIAVGGGSVMDLAKVMHLIYEHPDADLQALIAAHGSLEDPENDSRFPVLGQKAKLAAISTTGGSGAECSPFAIIRDEATGITSTIASSQFIPEIAIIDPDFSMNAPADITRSSGLNALTLAVKALLAPGTTDYVKGMALDAARNVFENLRIAYSEGAGNPAARIKLADAAALAGIAYGNACPTLDPDGEFYPTGADKKIGSLSEANLHAIAELAAVCGCDIEDCPDEQAIFAKWIASCETLIADLDD